jgi:hypothetical protein
MTNWAPIRLQLGPIHAQLASAYDARLLLTALLVRLQEQAPAEAAEWVQRDALRLCPVRPVAVERRDTLPSGPPAEHWDSKPRNCIACAPNQENE